MNLSRFNINIFIIELIFFIISFVIGIFSLIEINRTMALKVEIARLSENSAQGNAFNLPPELLAVQNLHAPEFVTTNQFVLSFLLATLFFIIVIRTKYGPVIIRSLFVLALFAGMEIIFRVWIDERFSVILALLLIVTRYIFPRILIHDITMILAIIGIAINFGMNIGPNEAIAILIIISIYDILAVYVTGHMVKMLKSSILSGAVFAMIVPKNFRDMSRTVSEAGKTNEKALLNNVHQSEESTHDFMYLGGGDLAFPLIMVITALKIGLNSAIFTAIGALVGLLVLNLIFAMQKERKPMAALPPLALFSILGFLVSLIKF